MSSRPDPMVDVAALTAELLADLTAAAEADPDEHAGERGVAVAADAVWF